MPRPRANKKEISSPQSQQQNGAVSKKGAEKSLSAENVISSKNHAYAQPSPFKSPRDLDFDAENPDYIKELQRPAVIKEDLSQMERSKRVRQILRSNSFRKELEHLATNENRSDSADLSKLHVFEQLSDLIISPNANNAQQQSTAKMSVPRGSNSIVPIADLRGATGAKYAKPERDLRNQLASLFRLMDLFRWAQGLSKHCSARFLDDTLLTNPNCLMYHEMSASQLLKLNLGDLSISSDDKQDGRPEQRYEINEPEMRLHQIVYKNRPDVQCIVHLTMPAVAAVSAMKTGLMPISQEAMIIGKPSVHEFSGYSMTDPREYQAIANDLGPESKVLLIQNNGFLICAPSIEQVFDICYILVTACETQIRAVKAGMENLVIPSQEAQDKVSELIHKMQEMGGGGGVNKTAPGDIKNQWKAGQLEWEAWMRILDNAGFRTGHLYRQVKPIGAQKTASLLKQHPEIATPPNVSFYGSSGYDTTDNVAIKTGSLHRDFFVEASPNYYQKMNANNNIHFERSASAGSKKVSKWLPKSESPIYHQYHQQPIRISTTPHQFLPHTPPAVSPNPKELKEKQKRIREQSRVDNISAGPQSKILEGVSFQEASVLKMLQDSLNDTGNRSALEEKILVGAASKGIVDREHLHNPQIFSHLYQSNPFAAETEQKIQKYVDDVGQKLSSRRGQQQPYSNSSTLDRFDDVGYGHGTGSESPESVSLMQAARDHNMSRSTTTPPPTRTVVALETTFDVNPADGSSSSALRASPGPKGQKVQPSSTLHEEKGLSEDEFRANDGASTPEKKDGKKHKFHKLSFLRGKKDKEKHADKK